MRSRRGILIPRAVKNRLRQTPANTRQEHSVGCEVRRPIEISAASEIGILLAYHGGEGSQMTIIAPRGNVIAVQTEMGFDRTLESVRAELLSRGFSILLEVDFRRELDSQIGISASQCVVLILWRAFEAYQALLSDPNGALMVPFSLAVHGNGAVTVVSVLRQPFLAPEAPLGIHVLGQDLNREMREVLLHLAAHERHSNQRAMNHASAARR